MRDIKFRGLREYDKKWLYGSLVTGLFMNVETKVCVCNILDVEEHPHFDCFQDLDDYSTDVITETVGQFTGLKDKNGVDIYEGDILKHDTKEEYLNDNCLNPSDVIYSETDFRFSLRCLKEAEHGLPLNWGGYLSLEVIGNIYENPELLQ